jgi:hypothetical protein
MFADDSKLFRYITCDKDIINLQTDLNNLNDWFKNELLKLNINKCKIVSYGRQGIKNNYVISNVKLDNVDSIKDLGVTFDNKLNFRLHITEKINKAYSILGIIKRNFKYLSQNALLALYKSL